MSSRLPVGFPGLDRPLRSAKNLVLASLLICAASSQGAHAEGASNVEILANLDEHTAYKDVWGYYNADQNLDLALITACSGSDCGLSVVDVSDRLNPVEIGFFTPASGTGAWADVKTYQNYAYLSDDANPLMIVNLLDMTLANLVPGFQAHNMFVDEMRALLYAGAFPGKLRIYSLADPLDPIQVGELTGINFHDICVRGSLAFLFTTTQERVWVVDVSDPGNPRKNGWLSYEGAHCHSGWMTEDGSYLLGADEVTGGRLRIIDVAAAGVQGSGNRFRTDLPVVAQWRDPADPFTSIHNPMIQGQTAFCSWYSAGVQIIDVTDPRFPDRIGFYDWSPNEDEIHGNWGVFPAASEEGLVFASDQETGLYLLRFTPNHGVLVGTVTDGSDPVAGAVVEIVALGKVVQTAGDGSYRMALEPGTYEIEVSAFGYDGFDFQASVSGGGTEDGSLQLSKLPSGTLTGTVTVGGAPLADAEVRVLGTPLTASTDNTGGYSFDSVPADTWSVESSRPGYGSTRAILTITADMPSAQFFVLSQTPPSHFYPVALGDSLVWRSNHDDAGCDLPSALCGNWVPASPNGSGGGQVQPGDDHGPGGGVAWVTGNGNTGNQEAVQNIDDVDRGSATLTSPAIPLADAGFLNPILRYYRWYSKDVVNHPSGEKLLVLISRDGQSWDPLEVVDEKRNFWERKEFPLRSFFEERGVAMPDSIWLRFIASETPDGLDAADAPPDNDVVVEAAIDDIEIFEWDETTVGTDVPESPGISGARLSFANPLRSGESIRMELGSNQSVQLDLVDVLGRRVRRLTKGAFGPGEIELRWDGRSDRGTPLPNGVYLLFLSAQGGNQRTKILLLR